MSAGTAARLGEVLGREELARLRASTVGVVGAGVLGGGLVHHLGLLGVSLVVIDDGRVAPENLANQGFAACELGALKCQARARQVAALDPDCRVLAVPEAVEQLGLGALAGLDLIATALDSRASRLRANAISRALGIPLVDAAVDGSGERLLGSVASYDPRQPDSACYGCRYGARERAKIAREGRGAGCPSWRDTGRPLTPPTLVASPFASIVSGFQALRVLGLLLGRESGARQLLVEMPDGARLRELALSRSPRCPAHVRAPAPLRPCAGERVGDLLERATADLGGAPDALHLTGRPLVKGLACGDCGRERRDLVRARDAFRDDDVRCACGPDAEQAPLAIESRLAGAELAVLAPRRWEELGVPLGEIATAERAGHEVHYLVRGSLLGDARAA